MSVTSFTKSLQIVESLSFAEKRFLGGFGACGGYLEIVESRVKLVSLEVCECMIQFNSNGCLVKHGIFSLSVPRLVFLRSSLWTL